jgi:hypothetical protein
MSLYCVLSDSMSLSDDQGNRSSGCNLTMPYLHPTLNRFPFTGEDNTTDPEDSNQSYRSISGIR